MHELGHNTVFKTAAWNRFFCHVLAFPGWHNHEIFQASHTRHHRYTLHPPDDLEVRLPIRLVVWQMLVEGVVNPRAIYGAVMNAWRIARGDFCGEWELTLFPPTVLARRCASVRWARVLLLGHAAVAIVSISLGWWLVPILVSLPPLYGGWLFYLCNSTQHIGMQDNVDDFRLCCPYVYPEPVRGFPFTGR